MGTFSQLSETKLTAIMTNEEENPNLYAAYHRIKTKYGSFPFKKEEYDSFLRERLEKTPSP